MNKKLLYYHGLGGCPSSEISEIFGKYGIQTIQMFHDYELEWDFDKSKSFMEKQIFIAKKYNPDIIFGISYGGYIAFNIARILNKPCMLINPALDRDKTRTPLKHITFNHELSNTNYTESFLGKQDELVPNSYTKEYLKKTHENYNIFEFDGEHNPEHIFFKNMMKNSKIINTKKVLIPNTTEDVIDQLQKYFGKKRLLSKINFTSNNHIIVDLFSLENNTLLETHELSFNDYNEIINHFKKI